MTRHLTEQERLLESIFYAPHRPRKGRRRMPNTIQIQFNPHALAGGIIVCLCMIAIIGSLALLAIWALGGPA